MSFICKVLSDTSFWGNIVGSFIGVIGAVYILKKQTKESIVLEKEMFIRKDRILKLEEAIFFCNEFELKIIEILKIIGTQQSVSEKEYNKILAIYLEMNKSFDIFSIQEDLFMEFDEMDNKFLQKFKTDDIFKEFDEKYKKLEEYITPNIIKTSIDNNTMEKVLSYTMETGKISSGEIPFGNIQINDAKDKIEEFKEILDKYRSILEYFKIFNFFMLKKKVEEKDIEEYLDKIKKDYDCNNEERKN